MAYIPADDYIRKEQLQRKHLTLYTEMQSLCAQIPMEHQQRLPYELLASLSNSLLDDTVYAIVAHLTELQSMREKSLYEQRKQICQGLRQRMQALQSKQSMEKETLHVPPPLLESAHQKEMEELQLALQKELNQADMKIITELDQCVSEQQVTLERAGVPGFYVTNNPQEIRTQMYLLDFINKCSKLDIS